MEQIIKILRHIDRTKGGIPVLQREQILIKQAKKGDVECFEELIKEHQQFAYNVALKILGNTEDAKDATQEAFIKVYNNMDKYREESKFSTWLYRIVANVCKDTLRKKKDIVISDDDAVIQIPDTNTDANPVASYERTEIQNQISEALKEVPEPFKTALVLCDMRGMSYAEISEIQEIALGTVRSRIHRARSYMRAILQKQLENTCR